MSKSAPARENGCPSPKRSAIFTSRWRATASSLIMIARTCKGTWFKSLSSTHRVDDPARESPHMASQILFYHFWWQTWIRIEICYTLYCECNLHETCICMWNQVREVFCNSNCVYWPSMHCTTLARSIIVWFSNSAGPLNILALPVSFCALTPRIGKRRRKKSEADADIDPWTVVFRSR